MKVRVAFIGFVAAMSLAACGGASKSNYGSTFSLVAPPSWTQTAVIGKIKTSCTGASCGTVIRTYSFTTDAQQAQADLLRQAGSGQCQVDQQSSGIAVDCSNGAHLVATFTTNSASLTLTKNS